MLGLGKIDFLKHNSAALSDGLGDIAFLENYSVTFGDELTEYKFIKAFRSVDCFHYRKPDLFCYELTGHGLACAGRTIKKG